jgi:lipoate-protein ligase A
MSKCSWRILLTEPASGEWNMAVDETLTSYVRATGRAVLRVYGWNRPTLSFGRNQVAVGRYDAGKLASAGVYCVRRPTGGRAVLHHREVTYAVAASESGLGSLRESYQRINAILLRALQHIGVGATPALESVPERRVETDHPHGTSPCFDTPSKGELVLGGRKLVGSAQFREGDVLLQHGSILLRDDQSQISSLLVEQVAPSSSSTHRAPATLSDALGREPAFDDVAEALRAAVLELEDPLAAPINAGELPAEELTLAHARYSDSSWTWRR